MWPTIAGVAFVALLGWATWSFHASGKYPVQRKEPPDLSGFRPGDGMPPTAHPKPAEDRPDHQ